VEAAAKFTETVESSSLWVCLEGGRPPWRTLLAETWRYRELLLFLAWRDIKVRYQQTYLGVAWAVFQPTLHMVVFALILGRLAGMQSHLEAPYAVFALAGLVPWTFAANALNGSATSLVSSQHLLTKVYFPRLLVPLAVVAASTVDLLIGIILLILVMPLLGAWPTYSLLFGLLPLLLLIVVTAALGVLVAGVSAVYRDLRFVVPFLVQVGLFVTPVLWPLSLVSGKWRWLVLTNPVAGAIEGFGQQSWQVGRGKRHWHWLWHPSSQQP
jgi:lipopolysaccharide transport system permease protein